MTAAAVLALLAQASAGAAVQLPVLTDVTAEAGIAFVHSIGDDELSNIVESTGAGCALFDADGDGDLDIYLVNGRYLKEISHVRGRHLAGTLRNALYRNNGDGTFTEVGEAAGVADDGYGMGCTAADFDNDGDPDLYVTNYGPNVLYRNNGDGTFTDVTAAAGVGCDLFSAGSAFLDYDRDGDLDLYVGNYLLFDPGYRYYYAAEAFPGPLSYRGVPDVLYRNDGDGTFTGVGRSAGIAEPDGRAMGVAVGDLDDDGWIDVFVANDGMENYAWRNRGDGTFENVALQTGTAFGQNGEATSAMGPELGDLDRDGLVDLVVPDMGYGCLYVNTGKGFFEDRSARAGLARSCGQYTSWSANLLDVDNDGLLDLFLTNGDAHHLEPEEDLLLRNLDGAHFEDVSRQCGEAMAAKTVSRGSAAGDYDDDGDVDLLVVSLNGPARLLRNDGGNRSSWLMIQTRGTRSNRDGIGARVEVHAGGVVQMRLVGATSGYLAQSDLRQHFGLGDAERADRVVVRWPSGTVQTLGPVAANQVLVVVEPEQEREKVHEKEQAPEAER